MKQAKVLSDNDDYEDNDDFLMQNIDDCVDEDSADKDAHIRNGETVPKLLEAPPLGQTLGLKRFIATELCAVFCTVVLHYCRIAVFCIANFGPGIRPQTVHRNRILCSVLHRSIAVVCIAILQYCRILHCKFLASLWALHCAVN